MNSIQAYNCTTCQSTFTQLRALKDHVQKTHQKTHTTTGKKYECTYCEKKFGNMYNRDRHQQIVHLGVKRFQCDICGLAFTFKWLVSNHKKEHHGIGEKIGCPCGKSFSHNSNFYAHQRICKTINPTTSKGGKTKPTEWECSVCGKVYSAKVCLQRHIKFDHDRDQNIICEICGEKFTRPYALTRHIQNKHWDPNF